MADQTKKTSFLPAVIIGIAILGFVLIWALITSQPQQQNLSADDEQHHQHSHLPDGHPAETKDDPNRPAPTIEQIINSPKNWKAIHRNWYGKQAPNLVLTDINGKTHRLSDYRGRDVLIIFWATWCKPCEREIPHLIALRNIIGEDKLAMLAISNEHRNLVKNYAAAKKINYTVLIDNRTMSIPYSQIQAIPSAFFIDAEGRIKLATEGGLHLSEIKAILRAR